MILEFLTKYELLFNFIIVTNQLSVIISNFVLLSEELLHLENNILKNFA